MADSRFFRLARPISLGKLARLVGAELLDDADAERMFADVAPLDGAGPDQVSFLDNHKYLEAFKTSSAGACVVHPNMVEQAPSGMQLLISRSPYKSYALVALAFYPKPPIEPGMAPTAVVDDTAVIGQGVRVEAGAVIGPRAEIGEGCLIGPNAVIGEAVTVGESDVDATSALTAEPAAFASTRMLVVLPARLPRPMSDGSPETPASAEPSSVHALEVSMPHVQALPTAVPHWPDEMSCKAPDPLL